VALRHRPRRAGHHAHAPEPLLDQASSLGLDLGDGERIGVPTGVEQAGEQRLTHAAATEQRELHHGILSIVAVASSGCAAAGGNAAAAARVTVARPGPRNLLVRPALPRTRPTVPHLGPDAETLPPHALWRKILKA